MSGAQAGVWGGSGYLGSRILGILAAAGGARALGRDELPEGVHLLVDASYPVGGAPDERERYLRRVGERSARARAQGARYVHIASTSSLPPITSRYGRLKARAESVAAGNGGQLLRAGLVVSDDEAGGRFGELLSIVRRLPVVPLPSADQFRLYVTSLDDLLGDVALYLREAPPPADRWVRGTALSSLAALLEPRLRSDQRVVHLGSRPSRAASLMAQRLHVGPLDSLASIASPPPALPDPEELDPC